MSKQHFNFKSSIRDWYIRAFPSDQIGYRINPLATFAGAVKCMADGGDIYKYLGVGDSLVRENVFSKIAAITGVDYDAVYDLWLHHDEDECSRLVFLGDHPDCAVDRDWREQFDEVASPSEQVRYDEMLAAEEHRKAETFDSFMEVNETPMDEVRGAGIAMMLMQGIVFAEIARKIDGPSEELNERIATFNRDLKRIYSEPLHKKVEQIESQVGKLEEKAAIYDEMRYTAEHTDPADIRIAEGSASMTGALMAAAMASYDLSCGLIDDEFAQAIESRLGSGCLGREPYVDSERLRGDLTDKFGFFYDIDFSGLSFKTSLILSVNGLYSEGDVIDAASDWQEDYLPCVCHRGGQGEDDRWEYEPAEGYRPFTRPADIPESIFDKLCASQGTTIEKVVNDPVTPFERSFREDIFNMPQNRPVGLAVLATLPLDAFVDASLSMICRGDCENAGTFTVKPGRYEPILGIYDPVGGCGGAMGTVLDCDFEIDPHDISYTMMEPVRGEWKSDRIDLYTPQDCFGFSDPFGGRIEYNEKKPEVVVAAKPDPVELGHRASVAAGSTAGGRARGAGIRQ